ncbi:hypothetical protein tloyanaT_13340 [Thalassotalea loyana]|uniref:TMhelix containing protein n=1 Tax=Thalassotalea loyana TaxID=280483 RepID=A0ABQ6HEC5_9GAMM|nr:hypothetical protein [Thalassotalea loyana]GLX85082.1 hypothetical protein tloyanaT_13340 [Thalassotalea loyana]
MIKFFKSLFSSEDTIKTGLNAIIDTGDALVYTDEEKAGDKQKKLNWYLELMKTLSPSARSRRGLAWTITGMVSILSLISVGCRLAGWHEDSSWVLTLLDDVWSWPFGLVVAFYFTLPHVQQAINRKTEQK